MRGQLAAGYEDMIVGVIVGIIMVAFAQTGLIPSNLLLAFNIMNIVGTTLALVAIPRGGALYYLGWAFGAWIMLQNGIEFAMNVIVPLILPALKLWSEFSSSSNRGGGM